jgi:hypothetical protein
MGPCIVIIFYYINPSKMHTLQSLFYLTTALHVSGVTITHLQEHKTTYRGSYGAKERGKADTGIRRRRLGSCGIRSLSNVLND